MNANLSQDIPAKSLHEESAKINGGYFRIHPGLGIARVGNSPNEFYIGPESPNWVQPPADNHYKDADGLIKRQAARFRVYEYDSSGNVIQEIHSKIARIVWTVTIANKKGSWYQFKGEDAWADESNRVLRNPTIESNLEPDQRKSLNITPTQKCIEGESAKPIEFNDGLFLGKTVCLGEIRTDELGRLLVLGGDGSAASIQPNNPVSDFANNDGWHDNIADGWVEATIYLSDGGSYVADRASVIIAPPSFAPDLHSLVTLDDQMQELSQSQGWITPDSDEVLFYRDIYPILLRSSNLAWVSGAAYRGHGAGAYGSFTDSKHLSIYSDASSNSKGKRERLFSILRPPEIADHQSANPISGGLMPLLYGSKGIDSNEKPRNWFSILPGQYARMKAWAEGLFTLDSPIEPQPLEHYPVNEQPNMLDRSALQFCAGGPFYPGIEVTFIATDPSTWRAPYRINSQWQPGDITKWMAVPWQSDFYECTLHWWPIQRPDTVLTEESFSKQLLGERHSWARGLGEKSPQGNNDMVKYWADLGFIAPTKDMNQDVVYVEQERNNISWPNEV